jgi:Galactosyltransferase
MLEGWGEEREREKKIDQKIGSPPFNALSHHTGQVYGLSGPIARYIARAAPVLHRFANEDVTLGAWLVGLEVKHVDERRLCCDSAERCAAQTAPSNVCLSYYEHQCAGICTPETRLVPIYKSCLDDPLSRDPSELGKGITDWDEGMELDDGEEEDPLDDDDDGGD